MERNKGLRLLENRGTVGHVLHSEHADSLKVWSVPSPMPVPCDG